MSIKLIDENKIMTKLSHTEPLFGEDGTKERYRYMQWLADTNAIKELPIVEAIPKDQYEARLKADMVEILDKIRAEMVLEILSHSGTGEEVIQAYADGLMKGLDILDKYKAESEEQ